VKVLWESGSEVGRPRVVTSFTLVAPFVSASVFLSSKVGLEIEHYNPGLVLGCVGDRLIGRATVERVR
jgi:hypothetical protein